VLIEEADVAAATYAAAAGPYAEETVIADREVHRVLPLLDALRNLPVGYAVREQSTPLVATFGLSQRDRLLSASENIYRIGLERMFRSRLLFRLEEQLAANVNNPGFVYEALKVYIMLGGLQPPDKTLIKDCGRVWRISSHSLANRPGASMSRSRTDARLIHPSKSSSTAISLRRASARSRG
jgi:type VI secretion system protein ImpL